MTKSPQGAQKKKALKENEDCRYQVDRPELTSCARRLLALDKTITALTVCDEILQELTQFEHDENEKPNVRVLISR